MDAQGSPSLEATTRPLQPGPNKLTAGEYTPASDPAEASVTVQEDSGWEYNNVFQQGAKRRSLSKRVDTRPSTEDKSQSSSNHPQDSRSLARVPRPPMATPQGGRQARASAGVQPGSHTMMHGRWVNPPWVNSPRILGRPSPHTLTATSLHAHTRDHAGNGNESIVSSACDAEHRLVSGETVVAEGTSLPSVAPGSFQASGPAKPIKSRQKTSGDTRRPVKGDGTIKGPHLGSLVVLLRLMSFSRGALRAPGGPARGPIEPDLHSLMRSRAAKPRLFRSSTAQHRRTGSTPA